MFLLTFWFFLGTNPISEAHEWHDEITKAIENYPDSKMIVNNKPLTQVVETQPEIVHQTLQTNQPIYTAPVQPVYSQPMQTTYYTQPNPVQTTTYTTPVYTNVTVHTQPTYTVQPTVMYITTNTGYYPPPYY